MTKPHILIVDDEEFIRDLLSIHLEEKYSIILAADGEEAWEIIDSNQYDFSVILLDCLMPKLDGLGLLKRIKADKRFIYKPVILQTGLDVAENIAEGIAAGAFYYLTKPFSHSAVCAVVDCAVENYQKATSEQKELCSDQNQYLQLFQQADFQLKTLCEAHILSPKIACFFPDPQRVSLGINELLINAIEHGNLGISYQGKSDLMQEGIWDIEIERRLKLAEHKDKFISVQIIRTKTSTMLRIIDQGNGFDWKKYLHISSERAFDLHGRGIAMSKMISFDEINYQGNGNKVEAIVLY